MNERTRRTLRGVGFFFFGFLLSILLFIVFETASDRWKEYRQARDVAACQRISKAVMDYRKATGHLPDLSRGVRGLSVSLVPRYLQSVPLRSSSGDDFVVGAQGDAIVVAAIGEYGCLYRDGFAIKTNYPRR